MRKKLLYFSSNKKSIPLLSPPGYWPNRIYAHQKRLSPGYKPWAYIRDFTVTSQGGKLCFEQEVFMRVLLAMCILIGIPSLFNFLVFSCDVL